jgi:hypothetical protein
MSARETFNPNKREVAIAAMEVDDEDVASPLVFKNGVVSIVIPLQELAFTPPTVIWALAVAMCSRYTAKHEAPDGAIPKQ